MIACFDWLFVWLLGLIDCLIDWFNWFLGLIDGLIDWFNWLLGLIDDLIAWFNWLIAWFNDFLFDCLIVWLIDCCPQFENTVEWRKCLQWDRAHLQSQAYYIQNYIYSRFKENQIDQQLELIFGLHSTFFCGRWKKKKNWFMMKLFIFQKKIY